MHAAIESAGDLRFDDGTPVRAASAVAPLAGGWLVAQDDATHAAWRREDSTVAVRVLPPVEGELGEVDGVHLLAVIDADDPLLPSAELEVRVVW